MWQPLKRSRKRDRVAQTSARHDRQYRPHCRTLEERRLLSVSLTSGAPPVPLVGSPVTWFATATDEGTTPLYQFSVGQAGGALRMVQDFSPTNSFQWNPMQQGTFDIQVIVKDSFTATSTESASATYTAESRVVGDSAVVSPMANPLVALYSAPPSPGSSMYVQFAPLGPNPSWNETSPLPIVPGDSTNFIVAGMLPNTTYVMRDVLNDGTTSAPVEFTTGSLPTNLTFPTFTEQVAPPAGSDLSQDLILHIGIGDPTGTVNTVATDAAGNVEWYYDPVANGFASFAPNLVPGGTVLMLGGTVQGAGAANIVRETDLAGDPLRETNRDAVNAELAAMGQPAINDFNHEALRLPNGDTAVLAGTTKTIDVNGTPTVYNGDMLIVLDQNLQVSWVWNAFDWLSTSRLPTLGEGPSDWTHANAIDFSPEDGDLVISLRNQDWVLKLDYDNGAGDGHIVWTLGAGGSFTLNSSDPTAWFSHQHDVRYVNDTTLVLFDDSNVRQSTNPSADSRGQEWLINEQTMTATPVLNADLGNFSAFLGGAQRLPDASFLFTSGDQGGADPFGQSIGVLPDGTIDYEIEMSGLEYRSDAVSNLYGTPTNLVDPGFEDPSQGTGASAEQANPTDSAWTYSGGAGVAGNGSAISGGNPNAPQGTQVAFLEQSGTISQDVTFPVAGSYEISVSAAQRANDGTSKEEVQVVVDGVVVDIFTPGGTGYTTYTTPSFSVTAGSHTIAFVGVGSGANNTALLDQVSVDVVPPNTSGAGAVDLSSAFNRLGIVANGTIITGGGLDGYNYAFSSSLVGPILTAGGATFDLGPVGADDVVSANGQVIALPSGSAGTLDLLATGVNGSQVNQAFTVTYTDGTTATFIQSISDWGIPMGYAGESVALATAYRDSGTGGKQSGPYDIYEYSFALDPTKTVRSITLPVDSHVEVFAATVVPAAATQVDLSSAFNRVGIAIDAATFTTGGIDGYNYAYSSDLIGPSLSVGGVTFDLGPAGANDVVSANGQVIALPSGSGGTLDLLATAVNGNQVNQTFTVTYTDGTTATFVQSISDWGIPKGYTGESVALATAYRDSGTGGKQAGPYDIYEYSFKLDPTKTVRSITLPVDSHVEVLAATVVPPPTTQANLSSAFNRLGIVTNGTTITGGGLDGYNYAFSASLVGPTLTAGGATFALGTPNVNDVVSAAGQVIALPSGNDGTLDLLATAVNGSQLNQTFTVTYTDGTTATFVQSISDWGIPMGYAGESVALATAYRDSGTGGRQAGPYDIYEYSFTLDATKTVRSITLPDDSHVEVLAVDVQP